MISRVRPSFWRAYEALDPRVREAARRSYQLFEENPGHPSLRFKKLAGHDRIAISQRSVEAGSNLAEE